ncbi:MAG: cobalamin-dependent protein [Nocardioides sp.]
MRIVVGTSGPDPEEAGAGALARVLRDAGHEVVWAGPGQAPEQLVAACLQEDADLLAVAVPAEGATGELIPTLEGLLQAADATDIGVRLVPAGTPPADVVAWAAALS